MGTDYVFCEVGTKFLDLIYLNLSLKSVELPKKGETCFTRTTYLVFN
jgi:hypothetical protein